MACEETSVSEGNRKGQSVSNPDCTVLVTSCDAYRDVEGPFLQLFRKYWPDCPFELVIVSETGAAAGFDRTILMGKSPEWRTRTVGALEQIETPYVLFLCNDYFLNAPVDTARILSFVETMRVKNALNYRLCPDPPQAIKNTAYSVSCKAGIWNREFMLALARKYPSAWEFERKGSYDFDPSDPRPLLVTATQEFPFLDVVHKGYWEPWAADFLRREKVDVDISRRGFPPLRIRVKEWIKNVIFRLNPDLVTRIQNRF